MIRPAQLTDQQAIGDLLYQVHDTHAQLRPDIFRLGKRKYSDADIARLIKDPANPVYVYQGTEGQVLGYVMCQVQETKGQDSLMDRKVLFIDDLCVDGQARGQGIGEKLYAFAEELAKDMGCQALTLNVWEANAGALRFYDRLGLVTLKRVMEKDLSDN